MKTKKHIQKVRNAINKFDIVTTDLFAQSVIQRAKALEESVDEGWFIPFLKISEVTGASVATYGALTNKPYVIGAGAGFALMAGIYHLLINRVVKKQNETDNNSIKKRT